MPLQREAPGAREDLSGPEDSEEEEDEEEEEAPASKWRGIESIFEAYQEYVEGKRPLTLFRFLHKTDHITLHFMN